MQRTNEHYLPRFLMKGFPSSIKGGDVKTWCFRHDAKPYETNIKNIGAEKDFHSSFTGSSADDSIRPLENRFGWYVDSLRRETKETRLDDAAVPELIANLTVRTKPFREEMTRSITMGMREVIARFRNPESLNKFALRVLGDPSYRVLTELAKFSPEYVDAVLEQIVKNPDFLRSPLGSLLTKIRLDKVERSLETDFPHAAKESHIHALSTFPVPETVIGALTHLQWHLVIRRRGTFILGDIGPVFKIENHDEAKITPIGVYQYDAAFLPISDTHLLAGLEEGGAANPNIEQINRFSSSCSQNFFISAFNTSREEHYAVQLSAMAELVDDNTMSELLNHLFG